MFVLFSVVFILSGFRFLLTKNLVHVLVNRTPIIFVFVLVLVIALKYIYDSQT